MSVLNRVIVILVALLVLAGAVITLLVATGAAAADVLPYGWFESSLQRAADASGGNVAAIIAVGVVIALGMIALLFLEVVPMRRRVPLLIRSAQEGVVAIDQQSVCLLAEKTAASAHNVRAVACSVRQRANGLLISCRPSVALGTSIPEVSAELQGKIKEAVEQFTGLAVAEVDVKAKYEKIEAKRLAVR